MLPKFELPYNFEPCYEGYLQNHHHLLDMVKCIYLSAWTADSKNTRIITTFDPNFPKTKEEYFQHIKMLQKYSDVCVIFQSRQLDPSIIDEYYFHGVKMYILADDDCAKTLKERYKDIHLILTITRDITATDLEQNDYTMYDEIVLSFYFYRHIDAIKKLPKKYNYVLMVNSQCYHACTMRQKHWFLQVDNPEEYHKIENQICANYCGPLLKDTRQSILIFPNDLQYFDPYVSSYKLLDRAIPAADIFSALWHYCNRINMASNPGHPGGEDYYNLDT